LRDVLLFNDLIIVSSHATKDRKVHGVIHLLNVTLENTPDKDEIKNAFDILSGSMFMYTFSLATLDQKKTLMEQITRAVANYKSLHAKSAAEVEKLFIAKQELARQIKEISEILITKQLEIQVKTEQFLKAEAQLTSKQAQYRDLSVMMIKKPEAYPKLLQMCGIDDVTQMEAQIKTSSRDFDNLRDELTKLATAFSETNQKLDEKNAELAKLEMLIEFR